MEGGILKPSEQPGGRGFSKGPRMSTRGGTARSDPWKPKITFLSKTHLEVLRNVKNMNF